MKLLAIDEVKISSQMSTDGGRIYFVASKLLESMTEICVLQMVGTGCKRDTMLSKLAALPYLWEVSFEKLNETTTTLPTHGQVSQT